MNETAATTPEAAAAEPTFDALPLSADVRRAIDAMGYRSPTPVQIAVFEPAAAGRSLVVQARTGTGKTAAFGLPIVDRLVRASVKAVQALVLCPTRELALQVSREVEQIGQFRGTKVVAIYGGTSMSRQVEALEHGAQIVVGTPGRVLDHLRQRTLDPSGIRILVLDEADEMLSMGFARELNAILELLPKNRQGMFFSATIPADIERLAHTHLKDTELITLSSDQVGALEVAHYVYVTRAGDKIGQLVRILEVEDPESAIIFCNTRDETQRAAEALKTRGFDADWLNGDLPQGDRERVMSATREGRLRFLVCTDVAARSIDISHLTHVINYDFPETAEQYVHRTGRTGRAGRTGTAIALVGPKDIGNLYLLRLTYKIRPIEKQLPSEGEVKTRAEMDLLQLFVEAFANRPAHPDDLSLARRLLTHPEAEPIVAGLLRDHLGARGGDVATEAAEARRARNPPPEPRPAPRVEARRQPDPPRRDDTRRRPRGPEPVAPPLAAPPLVTPPLPAPPSRSSREAARAPAPAPAREPGRPRASVASYTSWEPPEEADDEKPILIDEDEAAASLPRFTVEGEERAPRPERRDAPERAPRERSPRAERIDIGEGGDPAGFVQLFVNVGKREGLSSGDLMKLLTEKGIPEAEAGRVRIRDRMSFITVKKEAFERVVAALTGATVGGRAVVAELARGRG
jgi:ATP-dependent RNA helicase DeaD